ncbi:MAG TPA: fused MFS/spermidine synthase [Alphaproteobacteria bacterium]
MTSVPTSASPPASHALSDRRGAATLALFAATLFVGAGLVFWIQPLFTKMVLPMLGGSPSVWNTAMVFFQAGLLAGYAYAHLLSRYLPPAWQLRIHLIVLAAAFLFLPVSVTGGWRPDSDAAPVIWLLALMTVTLGLPFLAVSATAPLVQRWFSRTGHAHAEDPYFLYAASNLGSVLALVGYPLLFEPWLTGPAQSLAWTVGYVIAAVLIALAGVVMLRSHDAAPDVRSAARAAGALARPGWRLRLRWLVYAAVPSAMLLGVTAHITTDVAAAPLFWVIPLTLYLFTFVIAFSRRPLVPHRIAVRALPIALVLLVSLFTWHAPVGLVIAVHLAAFFITALACHGELARMRPHVDALTEFYLFLSIGGMLGGMFTALLAPVVFDGVYEYPLAIAAACALLPGDRRAARPADGVLALVLLAILVAATRLGPAVSGLNPVQVTAAVAPVLAFIAFTRRGRPFAFALALAAVLAGTMLSFERPGTLWRERSFFGVYRVVETENAAARLLIHGTTIHGAQLQAADLRYVPASYYGPGTPIADLIAKARARRGSLRTGVVGLGAGGLACHRAKAEDWRFYEIDPLVAAVARDGRYFDLLAGCAPGGAVVLGDARLSLVDEPATSFDLLIMDAFNGDAPPIHLITREALELYLDKLAPGGLVAVHISNRFVDLRGVIARLVARLGLAARVGTTAFADAPRTDAGHYATAMTVWVVIARDPAELDALGLGDQWHALPAADGGRAWTDDYSNILEAIRWRGTDFTVR